MFPLELLNDIPPASSHACLVWFTDCCEKLHYFWSWENYVPNTLGFKVFLWDQTAHDGPQSWLYFGTVTWKPQRQHRAMKTSKCDLPLGNLPKMLDVPVLGLFIRGWYWLWRWWNIKLRKSFSSNPESPVTQRTLSSPAGNWQPLVGAVLLCHIQLVPELSHCFSHSVFSLPVMVSEPMSFFCWIFAMFLLFLSNHCCEIVFPHPFPILRRDITTA